MESRLQLRRFRLERGSNSGPLDQFGKKRKLRWFGHVTRSFGLAKTILQGTVQGKEEKVDRRRGGKIILKDGQGWTLLAQQGQLKTGLCGKELL